MCRMMQGYVYRSGPCAQGMIGMIAAEILRLSLVSPERPLIDLFMEATESICLEPVLQWLIDMPATEGL
jgi:hypothetical protein